MKIFIATYNILFGTNKQVFVSLKEIYTASTAYPHACIALQEVRKKTVRHRLPATVIRQFPGFAHSRLLYPKPSLNHLGLLSFATKKPLTTQSILFPKKRNGSILTSRFGALVTTYRFGRKSLRFTNLHLDYLGGFRRKAIQIKTIADHLNSHPVDIDIVAGDFNTIGPVRFMSGRVDRQKRMILSRLGESFREVPVSGWTSDVTEVMSPLAPASRLVHAVFRKSGIRFRQKLDWIFIKGVKHATASVRRDLVGSDHYPVFAELEI